ncbi:arabinan endo-1,5-alpha-L-arabinosidase [Turicibacter bilis]|uniref:arabinan endo-1,5-alpha-L-arabinosidase n=1 Tax=Turicibacter bilis TaxID=2735723 RepID=UPI0031BB3474
MEEYVQSIRVNDDERMKLKYPKEPPKVHLYQGGLRETLMLEEKEWKTFNCHDPHIFKDEQTGCYYVYSTDLGKPGIHIRKSPDLIHWDYLGTGFEKGVPEEANKWSQAQGLWAPDIIKVGDEYRIYYSASTFGSQQSCIGLAVAKHPEGPFEHKGLVIKTTNEAPVNAIDANLVVDHKTGEQYMVYGSFWGGIRIIKLDSTTGLTAEDGFGIPLATRPREMVDTAVEGAYIRYNKQTGYYYLFVSYGSLASDYHVRVGRSKCITGPYVDYHNVEMTTINDKPNDIGLKITSGYKFGDSEGWYALGHNSVLNDEGNWYLVHHTRPEIAPKWPYLQVRKMVWTEDGWPLVCPCPYSGESSQQISKEAIIGIYDRIEFNVDDPHLVTPSVKAYFKQDQTCLIGNMSGTWALEGEQRLVIRYGEEEERHQVLTAWDFENWKPTLMTTGLNSKGICCWMKQID